MEEKITVQLTSETLYDFMLYHTYSKFAGFLSNILGVAVGFMGIILKVMGKVSFVQMLFYLLAAVAFLAFTPLQLKVRASRFIKTNEEYSQAKEYTFSDAGIKVAGAAPSDYSWEQIVKVVAAPKTIGFYYDQDQALIVPKEAFKDRFLPVMQIVTAHVSPDRIRMR